MTTVDPAIGGGIRSAAVDVSDHPAAGDRQVPEITLCPDGPMLVRGEVTLVDSDGAVIPRNRATIALCRCGRTALAPFCDGSHKLVRRPGAVNRQD